MANMNAKQTIEILTTFPVNISILIAGDHGRGKSQVVFEAGRILDCPVIDFRLSQNDVGDMKGMPFHINGRTVFAPPEWFPLTEKDATELKKLLNLTEEISLGKYGECGILFLDEINRANREVQQAAFELVLDHRLNLRTLPPGWRVVAAINANDDIYTVNSMEPAFLSRFFLIDFTPTTDEWLEWARDHEIHDSIQQFIRKIPEFLDPSAEMLKEAAAQGVQKVHDRRAWEKFSDTIKKLEADYESGARKLSPMDKNRQNLDYLLLIASGFIGIKAAARYKAFVETDYQSLDANVILNGWNDDVEKRIKNVVTIGRIPEIASYNELLIAYFADKVKGTLNGKQKENLCKYLELIPKELVADLWSKFSTDHKPIAEDWYRSNPNHKKVILGAVVKPKAQPTNA